MLPENSYSLSIELKKHGVPFEYDLFGSGGHGVSTCTQEVETPNPVCTAWVGLCKIWLYRQFEFTRKRTTGVAPVTAPVSQEGRYVSNWDTAPRCKRQTGR